MSKSDRWTKQVCYKDSDPESLIDLSFEDLESDLEYAQPHPHHQMRWVMLMDEPDLKIMVMRSSDQPIVIVYRKEDE